MLMTNRQGRKIASGIHLSAGDISTYARSMMLFGRLPFISVEMFASLHLWSCAWKCPFQDDSIEVPADSLIQHVAPYLKSNGKQDPCQSLQRKESYSSLAAN